MPPRHLAQRAGSGPPPAPPAPERRSEAPSDGSAPRELGSIVVFLTAMAAVLVFSGVLWLMTAHDLAIGVLNTAAVAETPVPFTSGQIAAVIRVFAVLTLLLGIGNGFAAQSVRSRKSWSRTLALSMSGIVLGISMLSVLAGGLSLQTIIFSALALTVIMLLQRPAVRDYLTGTPSGARRF